MMTKERRAELEALADEDPHMCLLRELLNEIMELEARAVVVPEYPENDFAIRESIRKAGGDPDFDQCIHRAGWYDLSSRLRAIPADRVLGDGQERIHAESESPTEKGWYECWAVDGRWGVRMQYRAWGNGCWWTPLADGWVSSKDGVYKWRGPVADIGGPAPDGTNPGSIRASQGGADHE